MRHQEGRHSAAGYAAGMSKRNLKKHVLKQRAKQHAQSITKAWVHDKVDKEDDSFDGFGYDDDDYAVIMDSKSYRLKNIQNYYRSETHIF